MESVSTITMVFMVHTMYFFHLALQFAPASSVINIVRCVIILLRKISLGIQENSNKGRKLEWYTLRLLN